ITRGYSRAQRPDLKQVMLDLIVAHQAGLPGLMKPLSGKSSDKPCHDLLYISGAFRRLYPVGTNSKSISCGVDNGRRAGRLNGRGRYSTKDSCGLSGSSKPWGDAKRVG